MKKIVLIALAVLAVALIYTFSSDDAGDEKYVAKVLEEIEGRKRYLQHNDQSPFNIHNQPYQEPKYYEVNSEYKVNARIERIKKREMVSLGSSTGKPERYQKFAWLHFSLLGENQKLLLLKPFGLGSADIYFCGFADETSGVTTYGGGRYLDVAIGKSDKTTLDFNLAYNPYCAYIDEYSCPLPPAENILGVSVEAGELIFK